MKKFVQHGREYTVKKCKARTAFDTEDKDALFITGRNIEDVGLFGLENTSFVVFGYDMPGNYEEWNAIVKDVNAWKNNSNNAFLIYTKDFEEE